MASLGHHTRAGLLSFSTRRFLNMQRGFVGQRARWSFLHWYFDLFLDLPSLISYKCIKSFYCCTNHSPGLKHPDGGMCESIWVI